MLRLATALAITLLSVVALAQGFEPASPLLGPVPILHITDGDTLVLDSNLGPRTVRLIGIDTPEMSAGLPGSIAKERLATIVPEGTSVWVELDLESEDRYGRLLAYLYVSDPDGRWLIGAERATQVNLAMVEAGWADTMTVAPNTRYAALYSVARSEARAAGRGRWGEVTSDPAAAQHASPGTAVRFAEEATEHPLRLHCALPNPSTPNDTGAEWVSVEITRETDTTGYYLWDEGSNSTFRLPIGLTEPGEIRLVNPGQGVWNNSGDTIYLMHGGRVVDQWTYTREQAVEDRVICR